MENLISNDLPIVPFSGLVRPVPLWGSGDAVSNQGQVATEVPVLISL